MRSVVYLLTVPLLAQLGQNSDTLEKERAVGRQYVAEIRKRSGAPGDPTVQAYVDRVGRDLLTGLTDKRQEYNFEVISGGDRTEPFALPGGYVFIPARIFIGAHDEDEVAGTLAHAIAHVALRHGTRAASPEQAANVASVPLVFMCGWSGSHADSQIAHFLMPVRLVESQRTYELEADRFGLELAARTGYDASALLRYVQRTQPADSKYSPLPGRDLRIARIQEMLASLPASTRSNSEDFKSVQDRVRSMAEPSRPSRVPTLRR